MKNILVKTLTMYSRARERIMSKTYWKNSLAFLRLPELKFLKTFGFIMSIMF